MIKNTIAPLVLTGLCLFLSSCKKDYTCECEPTAMGLDELDYYSGADSIALVNRYNRKVAIRDTRKHAEKECNSYEEKISAFLVSVKYSECRLK